MIKPKVFKAKISFFIKITRNDREKKGVIREKTRNMFYQTIVKNVGPTRVYQAAIEVGPPSSKLSLVITPSEVGTNKADIKKIIRNNEISKYA